MIRSVGARAGHAFVVLVLAGSLTIAQTARAHAAPAGAVPGGFHSWSELFAAQQPLDDVAQRIQTAAQGTSGYTNIRVDAATRTLTLYWKGQPPAAVVSVVDSAYAAGVRVAVVAARNSATELDALVTLISKDAVASTDERLLTITKRPDGNGVEVGVAATPGPRDRLGAGPTALGQRLPHLQEAARQGNVTVVAQRPAKDYARESDTPPYYGGGLVFGRGGACSSGFAGYNPRRNIEYLLTAAHCGGLNSDFTDGNGEVIGTVVGENGEYDTSFIETRSAPQVFDGPPVFASGQFIKPVRGAMHTVDGDWVCVSGATTGAVCGIQVDNAHIFDCSDQEMGCVRLIGGLSRTNPVQLVFGDGDSGGPVFSLTDNDTADVARGLVKGSYGTVLGNCNDPLNGHYPGHSRTRTCSTGLTFTDVLSAASPFDIRIQTELG